MAELNMGNWIKPRHGLPAEGQKVLFHHLGHVDGYVEAGTFANGEFHDPTGSYSANSVWVWQPFPECPAIPSLLNCKQCHQPIPHHKMDCSERYSNP